MASFDEAMLSAVESLFGNVKQGKFVTKQMAETPYEGAVGPGQINPAGWVTNSNGVDGTANVIIDADGITILDGALVIKDSGGNTVGSDGLWQNGPGTVVIDSTGITITDGAITLVDEFGSNVLSGAGFGTSWVDFIAHKFYNYSFAAGTTNTISAATETGGADTDAEYLASLSNDIPYWVVASESGAGTLKRVTDTAAISGFALEWNGTETAEVYQDIPVLPGISYNLLILWDHDISGGAESAYTISRSWRDKTHVAIGGAVEQGGTIDTDSGGYISFADTYTGVAPTTARYLRFSLELARTAGTPVIRVAAISAEEGTRRSGIVYRQGLAYQSYDIMDARDDSDDTVFEIAGAGGHLWWDNGAPTFPSFEITDALAAPPKLKWGGGSSAADAYLYRSAAKTFTFDADGASGALTAVLLYGAALKFGMASELAAVTTEGYTTWDDTRRILTTGDAVRAKPITPMGFQMRAMTVNASVSDAYTGSAALPAVSGGNGGALGAHIVLAAPMLLKEYAFHSVDTSQLRTAEFRLFYTKRSDSATVTFVTGTDATVSFTPSAASNRLSGAVSGSPVLLPPGAYILVIRNTSTAQTFGLGIQAATMGLTNNITKTIASLGTTLDVVTGWATNTSISSLSLIGNFPDGTTAW